MNAGKRALMEDDSHRCRTKRLVIFRILAHVSPLRRGLDLTLRATRRKIAI